jgi:hypothetical protein
MKHLTSIAFDRILERRGVNKYSGGCVICGHDEVEIATTVGCREWDDIILEPLCDTCIDKINLEIDTLLDERGQI